MRKITGLSFLLILTTVFVFPGGWVTLQKGKTAPEQGPAVQLLQDDGSHLVFQVETAGAVTGIRQTHGLTFATLSLPEAGVSTELGRPELPVVRQFIELPLNANGTVWLEILESHTYPAAALGFQDELYPVQLPVEKLPGAADAKPFQKDATIYSRDAFYPDKCTGLSDPLVIRSHNLVLVEFTPFQYNPVRREVRAINRVLVHVEYSGGDEARGDAEAWARYSPAVEDWMIQNVLNYRNWNLEKGTSTDKYAKGILFIVGNAYISNTALTSYIQSRQAEGHKVVVVNVNTIGNTDTAIRTYVRNQYLSWTSPALGYVVLVGDVADVATHIGSGGGNSQATDLYYSSIDPADYATDLLAPDIAVSRISVNDATELNTYINRAITYTTANFADTTWMKKWSFPASCDHYSVTEGTHNYVINTYTSSRGYTGTFPSNPTAGGDKIYCQTYSATSTNELNAFNNGRAMINDSGHGSETSWADPSFSAIGSITHATMMPFVISNACVTGKFNYASGDCWGEMWLAHNPGGAILYWGASNNSYWTEDDILEKKAWDGVFANGITRLGDIVQNAKLMTLANFGVNDTMKYYFEMYNMLGDATIDFYTDAYYTLHATYPSQIPIGVNTINFSVTNAKAAVANALVSVRGGNVQQTGYTDASGNVSIVMNPAPDTVMTLNVTITAHNGKRATGTIGVIPASGPYLSYASHEVTTNGTTLTTPNPGKHIVLPVTLTNVGSVAATGLTATLVTASGDVDITDNSATYSNIAAGASGRSATHFEITIHSDAPDATSIPFTINWTTTSRTTGSTNFNLVVEKPDLVYLSHTVDDSASGCDQDGIADVNEPTLYTVTVKNQGSGVATGAFVWLAAPNCTIAGPLALPDIPAGGQAAVEFTVTPGDATACPASDVLFTLTAVANELVAVQQTTFTDLLNADIQGSLFQDNMESGINGWTHASAAGMTNPDDWAQVTTAAHSTTHSWWASDPAGTKDAWLITPALSIGGSSLMTFWHKYGLESGYDGAVIEISTNSGAAWTDLGSAITANGYTHTISSSFSNPIGGRQAWSGTADWLQVTVDLSGFGPASVLIRFRIACDTSASSTGWWVDDVTVDSETIICQAQQCLPDCSAGDLDRNGACDAADCQLLASYLAGTIDGFTCATSYADLDEDLAVTSLDLVIMLNHVAGNIPTIPIP